MSTTTKPCGTCGLPTPDGTCPDCAPGGLTYHVEFEAIKSNPTRDSYRVIEYSAAGDRFLVVAGGLSLGEAMDRRNRYAGAARRG